MHLEGVVSDCEGANPRVAMMFADEGRRRLGEDFGTDFDVEGILMKSAKQTASDDVRRSCGTDVVEDGVQGK